MSDDGAEDRDDDEEQRRVALHRSLAQGGQAVGLVTAQDGDDDAEVETDDDDFDYDAAFHKENLEPSTTSSSSSSSSSSQRTSGQSDTVCFQIIRNLETMHD